MAAPQAPPAKGGSGIFSAKVMGIPVWMLVVAAGGLFWYYRKESAANAATAAAAGSSTGTSDTSLPIDPTTGVPYAYEASTYGGAGGAGVSGVSGASYTSNSSWYDTAIASLEAFGYNAESAAQALTDYLNGNTLSTSEQGLISVALQTVGNPPDLPASISGATQSCPQGTYYDPVSNACQALPGSQSTSTGATTATWPATNPGGNEVPAAAASVFTGTPAPSQPVGTQNPAQVAAGNTINTSTGTNESVNPLYPQAANINFNEIDALAGEK